MPTDSEHLAQAKHNAFLLDELTRIDAGKYTDWSVTVAFYSSLHFIEALIFKVRDFQLVPHTGGAVNARIEHSDKARSFYATHSDHVVRLNLLRDNGFFAAIRDDYITLYNMSRRARYTCQRISPLDGSQAIKRHQRIGDFTIAYFRAHPVSPE